MKVATFFSILSALATAVLLTTSANANLAIPKVEIHANLAQEEVDVQIKGDQAEVVGTFNYVKQGGRYMDLTLYLPVYAKAGTPHREVKPEISKGDHKLPVHFVGTRPEVAIVEGLNHSSISPGPDADTTALDLRLLETIRPAWAGDPKVDDFGELPQLEGQIVYWYMVSHVPQEPEEKKFSLKIRYTQKLANGKFIYTPLIPKQKEGEDYGKITVSADRPLTLIDADKHSFTKAKGKVIVKPSDKRAIIVELAKPQEKLP